MSTGSGATRAANIADPVPLPNCAWPAPTSGIGFLPGPPSISRILMPSSEKYPAESAARMCANWPLRSQLSEIATSVTVVGLVAGALDAVVVLDWAAAAGDG